MISPRMNQLIRFPEVMVLLVLALTSCTNDNQPVNLEPEIYVNFVKDLRPELGLTNDADTANPCIPVCDGKECGDDGCGSTCGECSGSSSCSDIGICLEMGCSGKELELSGVFANSIEDFTFDSVQVALFHKKDIDPVEDGCIARIDLTFRKGTGCTLHLEAEGALNTAGEYRLSDISFKVDSQCPGFSDALEGEYIGLANLTAASITMEHSHIMVDNVESWCFPSSLTVHLAGTLYSMAAGAQLEIRLTNLTVTGSMLSIGDENLNCPCEPDCSGKVCGGDGCGFTCGDCGQGFYCNAGSCEKGDCVPQCEEIECGFDGCGGTCGDCPDGYFCTQGICKEGDCIPECTGKKCGPDGCGDTCGSCQCGEVCEGGNCIFHACDGKDCGDDSCGGTCGTCGCGEVCMNGTCAYNACEGKVCGSDGCDGSCGTCEIGYECTDGVCEANCEALCVLLNCGSAGIAGECQCGSCEDGDPCTGDTCVAGLCPHPVLTGELCVDDDPCTLEDACQADGQCTGIPYQCTAPGICETEVGATCNGDGTCTHPAAAGTVCNDQNLCTHTDQCQADKSCHGSTYSCTAPGFCETALGATCKGDGMCTYPTAVGAICDDSEDCTWLDKCTAEKACLGEWYICDQPGDCETPAGATCNGDGTCAYPPDVGLVCDDGNACTYTDQCTAQKDCVGIGYSCSSPGTCEATEGAVCNGDGACAYPYVGDGTLCGNGLGACLSGGCCFPNCFEKDCGPDGCGGTCGMCACGQECILDTCAFTACAGMECGSDGCGGSCGACGCGEQCLEGSCSFTACIGKECGDDGCGGECGTCGCQESCEDDICTFHGCDGKECGDDGCGDDCGMCPGPQDECADGLCVCIPVCDGQQCGVDGCGGECGTCLEGTTCNGSTCSADCTSWAGGALLTSAWVPNPTVTYTDGVTLEAWVSWDNTQQQPPPPAIQYIMYQSSTSNSPSGNSLSLGVKSSKAGGSNPEIVDGDGCPCWNINGGIRFRIEQEDKVICVVTPFGISENQWHHLAAVYADDKVQVYIDGSLAVSHDVPTPPIEIPRRFVFASGLNGRLSSARASQDAEYSGSFVPSPVLSSDIDTVGYWFFQESFAPTIPDLSGNGLDLSSGNGIWHPDSPTSDCCSSSCAEKSCGPNGCGGFCGVCPSTSACADGACVPIAARTTISPGQFGMGCQLGVHVACNQDNTPFHQVYLDQYKIDQKEVTVRQYGACVENGACAEPISGIDEYLCNSNNVGRENHPVNCVGWGHAQDYCLWAGGRLCTEAEWERAAKGSNGSEYPWGSEQPSCSRAVIALGGPADYGCGTGHTLPVGSKPPDSRDMGGNVSEWVSDWHGFANYPSYLVSNPQGPPTGPSKVVRGGAFWEGAMSDSFRTYSRRAGSSVSWQTGLRCCE
jgi:hypothetical protein